MQEQLKQACMVLPRSEKAGAATRVDAVCSYYSGPEGFTLDRERLYWELSQMTQGVTHLGPYTLDRDSLYVNGEHPGCGWALFSLSREAPLSGHGHILCLS